MGRRAAGEPMTYQTRVVDVSTFRGLCDCGWKGPARETFAGADLDVDTHRYVCPGQPLADTEGPR